MKIDKIDINGQQSFPDKTFVTNYDLGNDTSEVKNIFDYLTKLAIKKRGLYKGKVIGITGSAGKTTLKETLAFFLKTKHKISYSQKSYNNKLGVLISLLNFNTLGARKKIALNLLILKFLKSTSFSNELICGPHEFLDIVKSIIFKGSTLCPNPFVFDIIIIPAHVPKIEKD